MKILRIPLHVEGLFNKASVFLLLLISFNSDIAMAMIIRGPITASSVTVTGDITVQNMTVSSVTIHNLDVQNATTVIKGSILQTIYSSGTVSFTTFNSTLTAVPGTARSITLLDAQSYVRITLLGTLASSIPSTSFIGDLVYLSIERDSLDLGQGALASTYSLQPAGVSIVDFPGDTLPHIYRVVVRTSGGTSNVNFTAGPQQFFVLQEITR